MSARSYMREKWKLAERQAMEKGRRCCMLCSGGSQVATHRLYERCPMDTFPWRALSVRQPWAWLIVNGHKDVENRTTQLTYRGPLIIQASKQLDEVGVMKVAHRFPEIQLPERFELGGIVGRVEMVDCVQASDSPWFVGPFGYVLREPVPLPFTRCSGRLGLFSIPHYVVPRRESFATTT